jgi:hypothetical protein
VTATAGTATSTGSAVAHSTSKAHATGLPKPVVPAEGLLVLALLAGIIM